MIRESFLPHLFFGNTKTLSPIVGTLSKMPIKVAGIGLLNTVMLTKEKYLSPQRGSAELISAVIGGGVILQFWTPMDTQGRNMWRKERPGSHEQNQTQGFSPLPHRYWQAPYPTSQNHRCLSENTQFFSFGYSIVCYRISGFLMHMLQHLSTKSPELLRRICQCIRVDART